MAGGRDLTYRVGVDASDAVSGLRNLERSVRSAMKTVEGEFDDSASAGDKFAASIDRVAAAMKEDFASAAIAAEELQRALKDAGSGMDVGDALTTLQRMGVSMDEVTADADKFAASLKQLDDVRAAGVKDLDSVTPGLATKLDNVSKSADSSRSALANMIGNSTQTMGQFVGITDDLGVGIGQIGEYFADAAFEGENLGSVFRSFAGVVGPMAALGAATLVMSQAMEAAQASRAFNAANVKQYSDAIKEGVSATASFNDEIRQTGELQFRTHTGGGFLGMFADTQDLLPVLERAGQDVASFNKIVEQYVKTQDFSGDANDRNRASLEAQGASMLDAIDITKAAVDEAHARIDAQQKGVRANELLASSDDAATASAKELNAAYRDAAAPMQRYADLQQEAADQAQRITDIMNAQADALNAQVDAATAAADQQLVVNDAFAEFGKQLKDNKASADDVRDAAIDLAKANVQLASDQAAASGATITSTQKLDAQNSALLSTAAAAKGPARSAILDYIGAVNQIPPEVMTQIQAAIDRGDIDEANRLLAAASAPRTAAITADANTAAAEKELNNTARDRDVLLIPRVGGPPIRFANGGTVGPGGGIAGEAGPELITTPSGTTGLLTEATLVPPRTRVTSVRRTRAMLGASVATVPVHVTVNTAVVEDRYAVERVIRRATRDGVRLAGRR